MNKVDNYRISPFIKSMFNANYLLARLLLYILLYNLLLSLRSYIKLGISVVSLMVILYYDMQGYN